MKHQLSDIALRWIQGRGYLVYLRSLHYANPAVLASHPVANFAGALFDVHFSFASPHVANFA